MSESVAGADTTPAGVSRGDAPARGVEPRAYGADARAGALARINRPRRAWSTWLEWAKTFQIAILLSLAVRALVVEAFKIPSGSMERTLLVGDYLLVNKLAYGAEVPFTHARLPKLASVARGDVIVFQFPQDPEKHFVKRVVGLAGDTVAMHDGRLEVNGRAPAERYAQAGDTVGDAGAEQFGWQRAHLAAVPDHGIYRPSRRTWGPLVVPSRHVFVLGDNRDNSLDSRYWGFVPDTLIRGRPLFVYFSYDPDSVSATPWLSRIRWARLGERIE